MSISSWTIFLSLIGVSTAYLFGGRMCCKQIDECFRYTWSPTKPTPVCPVGQAEPKYHLWTRAHKAKPDIFTLDKIPLDKFSESEKVYVIVHGWTNKYDYNWFQNMKKEFLKKEDVNVIIVDWAYLAGQVNYPQAASDSETVGAHIAKVLEKIKAARNNKVYTWCVGFSLGAHACGYMGKRTHLNRITALDPAGPGFKGITNRLAKEDADFVDVIHTNFLIGLTTAIGHVDFYPNGGHTQPMCAVLNFKCSHEIAPEYFISSINNKCFKTKKCRAATNWGTCEDSNQQMGYHASADNKGIFYLKPSRKYPFC